MTRGGQAKHRAEPERRCIVTGEVGPAARLIRFVLGPDGEVVPDLAGRLPGRGAWLAADRVLIERAVAKKLFSRAFRSRASAPADLADRVEALLVSRLVGVIGLARKAGQAVTGYEKVRARLLGGSAGVLVEARDGAADGRAKLSRLARTVPVVTVLDAAELGLAFGRDFAIHAALDRGGLADRAVIEAARLIGLRSADGQLGHPQRDVALPGDEGQRGAHAPGQGDE